MRVEVEDDVNGLENVVRWSDFGGTWGRWLMERARAHHVLHFELFLSSIGVISSLFHVLM
jgi:hypothetical protein